MSRSLGITFFLSGLVFLAIEKNIGNGMTEIYHILDDGRIIEVRNWTGIRAEDAILARPLNDDERQKYYALKALTYSDREIFGQLNPDFAQQVINPEVSIPLEKLTKNQIVWCINRIINCNLSSLAKMSIEDLTKLFLALSKK